MNEEFIRLKEIEPNLLSKLCSIESKLFDVGDNKYILPMFSSWGRFYIFKIEGEIAAAAQIIKDFDNNKNVFMWGFWVLEKFRGKGIGLSFLNKVLIEISKDDIEKVYLTVALDNKEATSLYEKMGFQIEEEKKDYYGKGYDRLLLSKRL